jgi:hypothetical protein
MTSHKHAELIKAWADGAEIEVCSDRTGEWVDVHEPYWAACCLYRIKPEPKPDIVEWHNVARAGCTPKSAPNIKLTFDGDTGRLIEAELV